MLINSYIGINVNKIENLLKNGQTANLATLLQTLFVFMLEVAVFLAVIMIAYGGFLYLTARDNQASVSTAKNKIKNAIIGLILALTSYSILSFINPDLVKIHLPNFVVKLNIDNNFQYSDYKNNKSEAYVLANNKCTATWQCIYGTLCCEKNDPVNCDKTNFYRTSQNETQESANTNDKICVPINGNGIEGTVIGESCDTNQDCKDKGDQRLVCFHNECTAPISDWNPCENPDQCKPGLKCLKDEYYGKVCKKEGETLTSNQINNTTGKLVAYAGKNGTGYFELYKIGLIPIQIKPIRETERCPKGLKKQFEKKIPTGHHITEQNINEATDNLKYKSCLIKIKQIQDKEKSDNKISEKPKHYDEGYYKLFKQKTEKNQQCDQEYGQGWKWDSENKLCAKTFHTFNVCCIQKKAPKNCGYDIKECKKAGIDINPNTPSFCCAQELHSIYLFNDSQSICNDVKELTNKLKNEYQTNIHDIQIIYRNYNESANKLKEQIKTAVDKYILSDQACEQLKLGNEISKSESE